MDAIVLPDLNHLSETEASPKAGAIETKKVAQAVRKVAFSSVVKLLLTSAVGLIAWTSWKPGLYDQYKVNDHQIVEQLAKAPDEELKAAAVYFKDGDYYGAKQIVSKHYLKNLNNLQVATQYAEILIASDCFETSREVLFPIYESGNVKFRAEAAYLLALSSLKEGNIKSSKEWLRKVTSGTAYDAAANELLVKLEEL